jgi:cytosine/adenosine deaminase-related metal-dependent hydrolase
MSSTIVRGRHVVQGFLSDAEPVVLADAGVLVQDEVIVAIGPFDELHSEHPDFEVIGGNDSVVMPGLVNAHHHLGLTPFQLGSEDLPLELWLASRVALRDVDLYLDTLYSAFEMVASGVTTVQHLHSRVPGPGADVLAASEEVIRAYHDVGMRVSYSIALRDQNRLVYGADDQFVEMLPAGVRPVTRRYFERFTLPLSEQIATFEELHRRYRDHGTAMVQLAPANLHWLSDDGLKAAAELSDRTRAPMHMHLVETPYQKAYAARRSGLSALEYIERMGLLRGRLTLGHGVWLTESDIELCAATGTRICHNCSSNLRLKSGLAPLNRCLQHSIPVAIGIDEAGINDDRDMFQEMRMVLLAHREPGIEAPFPSPARVLQMATEGGAGTTPFASSIGSLRPGMAADLVVLDWNAVTYPYQSTDVPVVDVLVHRGRPGATRLVMVAGQVVYRDGQFTRVDRTAVLAEIAARLARPLTPAEAERVALAKVLMPHVRQFYDGYLSEPFGEPHYRLNSRS